jgi:hypothetical protein
MELLQKMIQDIAQNYGVKFVIEKVTFENESVVYRLKSRREIKIFWHKRIIDEHELNYHSHVINFKSYEEIAEFLKFKFSEREGFLNQVTDLDLDENAEGQEPIELELLRSA